MNKFTKKDRSKFSYWFAHLCAFNMVAVMCGHWKFKYLFHDWEKPWLRLLFPYEKVQKFHRTHSRHHLEYRGLFKKDYEAMVIDWECSRYTKEASPKTAKEKLNDLYYCGSTGMSSDEYMKIYETIIRLGL